MDADCVVKTQLVSSLRSFVEYVTASGTGTSGRNEFENGGVKFFHASLLLFGSTYTISCFDERFRVEGHTLSRALWSQRHW